MAERERAADAGGYSRDFDLTTYYPIFLYLVIIIGFAVVSTALAHIVAPRKHTLVKMMPYESGMDPIGDARQHFDVKFYLIAILFLVFDVELLFLYPWAVVAYREPRLLPEVGEVTDVFRAERVFEEEQVVRLQVLGQLVGEDRRHPLVDVVQ